MFRITQHAAGRKSRRFFGGGRWAAALMAALLLSAWYCLPAMGAAPDEISYSLRRAIDYYYESGQATDWKYALGLAAAADAGARSYQAGNPDLTVITDLENRIIGMAAAQQDPTAAVVSGQVYNFVQLLVESQDAAGCFGPQGSTLNTTIWGMIALDVAANQNIAAGYDIGQAVGYIKSEQKANGGFDESGWGEDADSTAHALIALAPHLPPDDPVIIKGLEYLHSKQLDTGGIDNWGENPASTAAVIEALIALGKDPQAPEWTKNGKTLADSLLSYQIADGSFVQDTAWGPLDNTPYALLGLADLAANTSKYRRQLVVEPTDVRVFVSAPATLAAGGDADFLVKAANNSGQKVPALVIAALYDAQGRMLQYSYASREIEAGQEQLFGLGFSLPAAGGRVKIMTWDTWGNRRPVSNAITIPVR